MNVVDGGEFLDYTVKWPSMIVNAEEMHGKWLVGGENSMALQSYHPMIGCFEQFISKLRTRESVVRTTARIPLPFEVESRFEYYLLKSTISSARVLYVRLKAPARQQLQLPKKKISKKTATFQDAGI